MTRDYPGGLRGQAQPSVTSESPVGSECAVNPQGSSGRVHQNRCQLVQSPLTAQQLFYRIKQAILSTVGPGYLEYESILPDTGYEVARMLALDGDVERESPRISHNPSTRILSVTMPTRFHNCHLNWAHLEMSASLHQHGFFTWNEFIELEFGSNSGFHSFPFPWHNIYKEPDCYITPRGAAFPTIVFEAGYWKLYPQLLADKDLWFNGTTMVNVVVLVKWSRETNGSVKGFVDLWRRGVPSRETIEIFPAPAPGTPPQTLTFYRGDFYVGGAVPAGRNPLDPCPWSMDSFRRSADAAIRNEGLVPA
ncbi:hypothetical protein DTO212C5_4064 [Paecilomyces variotii]|nr:hypothetical protein DTO212C5_4064 [Paecilomyces variotii]